MSPDVGFLTWSVFELYECLAKWRARDVIADFFHFIPKNTGIARN
jgi:hypothetical protein